jgi:hypothetical protein
MVCLAAIANIELLLAGRSCSCFSSHCHKLSKRSAQCQDDKSPANCHSRGFIRDILNLKFGKVLTKRAGIVRSQKNPYLKDVEDTISLAPASLVGSACSNLVMALLQIPGTGSSNICSSRDFPRGEVPAIVNVEATIAPLNKSREQGTAEFALPHSPARITHH